MEVRKKFYSRIAVFVIAGRVWRTGRVDAFRPKGHRFESRSSRHVVILGKSFTHTGAET